MVYELIKSVLSLFRLSRRLEAIQEIARKTEATLSELEPKVAEMLIRATVMSEEAKTQLARNKLLLSDLGAYSERLAFCEQSMNGRIERAEAVIARNDKGWHKILDKIEAENRAKFVRRRYGSGSYIRHDDRGAHGERTH